jgi:hypothetical protein
MSALKPEDFEWFWCNQMNNEDHQGIEMNMPMDNMTYRL